MKTHTILRIAALLPVALTILTGCLKTLEPESPQDSSDNQGSTWTLTLEATKGEVGTKALYQNAGDPGSLSAYWSSDEKVTVFKDGAKIGTLTVTPHNGERSNATLSGPITLDGLAQNDVLTLMIPREEWNWSYIGQNGLLTKTGNNTNSGSIEENYDYAMATVTVKSVSGSSVSTTGAIFENQQSIYRFGFKVGNDYFDPKEFIVSAAKGQLVTSRVWDTNAWTSTFGPLTITPSAASSDHLYYVSIRNESSEADTYNFMIYDANYKLYLGHQTVAVDYLGQGKFLNAKEIAIVETDFAPITTGNGISNSSDVL